MIETEKNSYLRKIPQTVVSPSMGPSISFIYSIASTWFIVVDIYIIEKHLVILIALSGDMNTETATVYTG